VVFSLPAVAVRAMAVEEIAVGNKWLNVIINHTNMKKNKSLLGMLAFILTFFGLFTLISLLVVIIFPVSWNDVVTNPYWLFIYFFLGIGPAVMVVDEVVN
jgi:hypothetical protein